MKLVLHTLRRAAGLPALLTLIAIGPVPALAAAVAEPLDTLEFVPQSYDTNAVWRPPGTPERQIVFDEWLAAPIGDRLLTDPDQWTARNGESRLEVRMDYNRVDALRMGAGWQAQAPETMAPRFGARLEYAFGRERTLYGMQLEQPLVPFAWLSIGVSLVRRTDHAELEQVSDIENTLALLLGRQDYRDYYEREGFGGYLASRLNGISTLSAHLRSDTFRSLETITGTGSLLHRDRELRQNPPIAAGRARTASLRLERLAHRTERSRAGFYHWLDYEQAGGRLGGDFRYTRLLGDARSVVRLSPATTLALRIVGGSALSGALPAQRAFLVGGVDGLRAHPFGHFRGDQMALAQAEYTAGLWRLRSAGFEGGLHAIAFLDAGRAWSNPDHSWDLRNQRLALDGGFGLGTSEDNLRVYFAKNLRDADSPLVISARLQRPF